MFNVSSWSIRNPIPSLVLFGVLAGNGGGRKRGKHKNGSSGCRRMSAYTKTTPTAD